MEVDGEGVLVGVVVIGLCNTPPSIYHSQQEINSRGGDPWLVIFIWVNYEGRQESDRMGCIAVELPACLCQLQRMWLLL